MRRTAVCTRSCSRRDAVAVAVAGMAKERTTLANFVARFASMGLLNGSLETFYFERLRRIFPDIAYHVVKPVAIR